MNKVKPLTIQSISELHRMSGLHKPSNPLITIIRHNERFDDVDFNKVPTAFNCYIVTIKRSFQGQLKYGKTIYDFDEGTISFTAPNQIISIDNDANRNTDGWSLLFHPDLIRQYPLGKAIKNYGFFLYSVNEALHLSDEEEQTIETIIQNMEKEINSRLDNFSQEIIISNLELLLSYCNRFYNRQFMTRKMVTNGLLERFEVVLENSVNGTTNSVLPTVEKIANELNVSSPFLSDMLRNLTGQSTQQHIHNKLIEKAKEILTTTELSVGEIAYQLGFEYPQSFSKLFKNKTNLTPVAYRYSFN